MNSLGLRIRILDFFRYGQMFLTLYWPIFVNSGSLVVLYWSMGDTHLAAVSKGQAYRSISFRISSPLWGQ